MIHQRQPGTCNKRIHSGGFTLIEVMVTLLILAALALLSYRGLDTVLTSRDQVRAETEKWLQLEAFITRFKQDVQVAAPYPLRSAAGLMPAWQGRATADTSGPQLEFSRFAAVEGQDRIRRVAYTLNAAGDLELWLWPGLDAGAEPARYPVLHDVVRLEFDYMNAALQWVSAWPLQALDAAIPRAVRLTLELGTGEVLVRVFALGT
jgi:general secretion pathway protein J